MVKYIVSYGGGWDSTAMLIGLKEQGMPVDHIVFADTGGEKPDTYAYLRYFNEWLITNGMPAIQVVKYQTQDGKLLTLEQDCLNRNTLPAIAFGWKTCSQKYKVRPFNKWVKENVNGDAQLIKYLGFEAGEERRVKPDPEGTFENRYPLIEWGWNREKVRETILRAGLILPPKSSCFFCPNARKYEILALPQHLKERVIAMEQNATTVAELKGLGRQFSWTSLIEADSQQQKLFDEIEMFQTPCECID